MKSKPKFSAADISRRNFLFTSSTAAMSIPLLPVGNFMAGSSPAKASGIQKVEPVWRNKQEGMAYRQLGRTGFMISEVVNGGTHITPENIHLTEMAVERGLNYLDTAPNYKRGVSEDELGKLLKKRSWRDKIFLTTKISGYASFRNNLYKEIFDTLPSGKKEELLKKAKEMRKERGVDRTDYFLSYFNGQSEQMDPVYLSNVMVEEYGERVEGSPVFEKMIFDSFEASLKRLQTDHVDILMCPHAACSPEELNNPYIHSAFEKLKKQGKVSYVGFSTHNDPARVLSSAIESGKFDVVMLSYNIVNHGFLDHLIQDAAGEGIGIIAMKVAKVLRGDNTPAWRQAKINHLIPGDLAPAAKCYLWALQNPYISSVISEMMTENELNENLALAGQKIIPSNA
jgi:aryl-alcohol dehydrogenase-like predicted oxidoreductase